jgi:hypothetical protein
MVARYQKECQRKAEKLHPAPRKEREVRPERKPTVRVRPPSFERGTTPEEKIAALNAAGFVQTGTAIRGNPLFRHPDNPADMMPFELYVRVSPVPKKPEVVRVREDGTIVPADGKHTHKHRKVHGRPHLTEDEIAARKAARATAKRAPKTKKAESDSEKSKTGGKNKNGTQKKK